MGQVMQRAGGGKVTTENLTADNVKSGVTVTVKQGSRVIQSIVGTHQDMVPLNWTSSSGSIAYGYQKYTASLYANSPQAYRTWTSDNIDVSNKTHMVAQFANWGNLNTTLELKTSSGTVLESITLYNGSYANPAIIDLDVSQYSNLYFEVRTQNDAYPRVCFYFMIVS